MSSPADRHGQNRTDPKAWFQELKSSRKTQVALVALVLVLGYLLWPATPQRKSRPATASRFLVTPQDEHYLESLQKLRDLTQLDQAGELPDEGRMYRDLFLFDMPPPPPPPPPKPIPPPPPPPPPTQAELEAARLAQARQEATNSRPQTLRYLGYMGRLSTGRIASFLKGEEIVSLRVGDLASPNWKVVAITDTYAEFQHLKFQDIRYRTEATDRQGNASTSPTNEF
jgi:hypothetical protein